MDSGLSVCNVLLNMSTFTRSLIKYLRNTKIIHVKNTALTPLFYIVLEKTHQLTKIWCFQNFSSVFPPPFCKIFLPSKRPVKEMLQMSTSRWPTTAVILRMDTAETTEGYLEKILVLYSGMRVPCLIVSLEIHSPEHFPYSCFKTRAGEHPSLVKCSWRRRGWRQQSPCPETLQVGNSSWVRDTRLKAFSSSGQNQSTRVW